MILILLRHGDRNPGFNDVSLSDKGLAQAQELAHKSDFLKIDKILCSPKMRARQTIEPLSHHLAQSVHISNDLDQMKQSETSHDFALRVQKVLSALPKTSSETWLLCSHSDWLQQAVFLLASEKQNFAPYSFFSCAEYKVFISEHNPSLTKAPPQWTIQS